MAERSRRGWMPPNLPTRCDEPVRIRGFQKPIPPPGGMGGGAGGSGLLATTSTLRSRVSPAGCAPRCPFSRLRRRRWSCARARPGRVARAPRRCFRTPAFDFLQATAGEDGAIEPWVCDVPRWIGILVPVLDEQPALLVAGSGRTL